MANGDAAAAAGMDVVPSTARVNLGYDEINKSRDYIAARTQEPGTPLPIAKGGTGAGTAAAALTNLNAVPWTAVAPPGNAFNNQIARYSGAGRLQVVNPATGFDVANVNWVEARIGAIPIPPAFNGGVVTGQIYLPNSTAATSGYVVAYINGDGRISRGASSRRYKKHIRDSHLVDEDLAPRWREFQMKGGDGSWLHGVIAEELAEDEDLARFVVYDAEGLPDAVDHIQLLLALVSQQDRVIRDLSRRVAYLEGDRDA